MKFILSILLAFCILPAFSQGLRLNGYAAYAFDDNVDSYYDPNAYYNGKIKGGFMWGVGLEYMLRPTYGLELSYTRMDTKAPLNYYNAGPKHTNFDLGVNYIMFGGNRYFRKPQGKVEGFFGIQAGLNVMGLENPDNKNSASKSFFAWGLKAGANFWASEKVGIKLQANLLSAVQSVGGGFYFGTGGAGAGVSSYSTIYQFGLGGGLVFNLMTNKK